MSRHPGKPTDDEQDVAADVFYAPPRSQQWTLSERIKQWREQATFTPGNLYEEGRAHAFERCADEAELAAANAVPIKLVRQRACDFGEGYSAGYDDGLEGNASDSETAWDRSRASAELASPEVAAGTPHAPNGWQPIATCPQDGSWFLGWNEDCGCFVWRDGPGLITGEDPAPTHWMPLPAPPTAGDAAGTPREEGKP
jgi:hypothetical protein